MSIYYFVRHGQIDGSMAGKKFYKDFAYNMLTLSEKGIAQIHETAKDKRLRGADIIITSPFGRAIHSAAILSKDLNIEMRVETDLHEWLADGITYNFLSNEEAERAYNSLGESQGHHPNGTLFSWESSEQMRERVMKVLERYKSYHSVIVVCHGTLMQYVLNVEHPKNGQIIEFHKN